MMTTPEKTLEHSLLLELERNERTIDSLKKCGPAGEFCTRFIVADVAEGRAAIASEDPLAMMKALGKLRLNSS